MRPINQDSLPETAESLLITNIPTLGLDASIADAEALLVKKTKDFETINYLYIVDKNEKLKGVLSVKELYRTPKTESVKSYMTKELITARPHTHQERLARLALKHSIKAIPIVNKDGKLLGVVPSDTILQVLEDEHTKDILLGRGIHGGKNILSVNKSSTRLLVKARIPWLFVGLFGGLISAEIIERFQFVLEQELLLASFIPLIVYMGDAVGAQSQALFIRAMSLGEIESVKRYIFKEVRVGISIAFIVCATIGVAVSVITKNLVVAAILSSSMFLTIVLAVVVALLIPSIVQKFGKDPAIGSGPFATIIRDTVGILTYFIIAQMMFLLVA